jgi:hypothetical protein
MANVQADYQCFIPAGAEDIEITAGRLGVQNYMRIGAIVPLQTDDEGTPIINADEISLTSGGDYNDAVEDVYDLDDTTPNGTSTNGKLLQQALLAKVGVYGQGMYNYGYKVPDGKKVKQPTRSSQYFNPNHAANKYTIAKLDLEKTNAGLVINPSQII